MAKIKVRPLTKIIKGIGTKGNGRPQDPKRYNVKRTEGKNLNLQTIK